MEELTVAKLYLSAVTYCSTFEVVMFNLASAGMLFAYSTLNSPPCLQAPTNIDNQYPLQSHDGKKAEDHKIWQGSRA